MRLFVCALLVTIVAVAMLVDDAQSWRRRAVARLDQVYEADDTAQELREVVEETGDILDLLEEKQEQLLEELQENPEEEDSPQDVLKDDKLLLLLMGVTTFPACGHSRWQALKAGQAWKDYRGLGKQDSLPSPPVPLTMAELEKKREDLEAAIKEVELRREVEALEQKLQRMQSPSAQPPSSASAGSPVLPAVGTSVFGTASHHDPKVPLPATGADTDLPHKIVAGQESAAVQLGNNPLAAGLNYRYVGDNPEGNLEQVVGPATPTPTPPPRLDSPVAVITVTGGRRALGCRREPLQVEATP
ncbi:hypothetical protein Bbelb_279860 [Branchiostoma belcheri]|nr:hypothetical protein Bbelb_279860 [Branchiostoma belcheri]